MFDKLKKRLHRLDALQRKTSYPREYFDEEHECAHCHTHYVGRFCPQCSQEYGTSHFTMKTIMHNILDVIGFEEYGNRSILRTLRDLLWRPGYMIRDYLGGHKIAYFQPFKLLLLLTVVFGLIVHWMGVEPEETKDISEIFLEYMKNRELAKQIAPYVTMIGQVIRWIDENLAYSIILQNFLIVTAMWKVYRHRSPYSWTETFVAQMFICCQFMLLAIVQLLLTWEYEEEGIFPYFVNGYVVFVVLLYDFHQLYGETHFRGTLKRLIKVVCWLMFQYMALIFAASIIGVGFLTAIGALHSTE